MAKFSSGKNSKAISDRSGLAFPYTEMRKEWTGALVHTSEFENKHPQLTPPRVAPDPESIQNARPDRVETVSARLLPGNPFHSQATGTNVIFVHEPSHNRQTGDRVRFRNCSAGGGFTKAVLENAFGYLITVPANSPDAYHFTASSGTSTEINVNHGGNICTVGPVTIQG